MGDSIKFACVGDWGNGNDNQYLIGNLLNDLITTDEIEFICGLGDNFYPHGLSKDSYETDIEDKFTKPFKKCEAPFYMVLGNHDYLGEVDLQIKELGNIDDRWILPYKYYDFTMKTDNGLTGYFICFDSNVDYYTKHLWKEQTDWLEKRLDEHKDKEQWTILLSHHPWKSTGSHGNSSGTLKKLYEHLTNKYKIDFILNGHDHDKQLIITKNNTKQIISGTGSIVRNFPKRETKSNYLRFYSETLGICKIELFNKKAIVTFMNEYGKEEYKSIFLPKSLISNLKNKDSNKGSDKDSNKGSDKDSDKDSYKL